MHNPSEVAGGLAGKVSARSRHICILLGAGASRAAGLPDLQGLQREVLIVLDADDRTIAGELFEKGNIETALSYLRRVAALLDEGERLRGLSGSAAQALQDKITHAIIPALDSDEADAEPFQLLASWIAGGFYQQPVEVFTINYDLLIERGLEEAGVPYFDGFVGNLRARFRADLIDDISPGSPTSIPPEFVRLWKLHGSVNWAEERVGDLTRIVRLGVPVAEDVPAAIYPTDEKYDQSRRVPFVVLLDRFRRSLAMPETVTIISGYSFGDQHLNELIFDAARSYPRSEVIAFCYGDLPEPLLEPSARSRNFTVLGRREAVVGGRRGPWSAVEPLPGVWDGNDFLLGDFSQLARLFARADRTQDGEA